MTISDDTKSSVTPDMTSKSMTTPTTSDKIAGMCQVDNLANPMVLPVGKVTAA